MTLANFIAGLTVLQAAYTDEDSLNIGADHDRIYAFSTHRPLTEAEATEMRRLGWFQPEAEDEEGPYEPQHGWAAYT